MKTVLANVFYYIHWLCSDQKKIFFGYFKKADDSTDEEIHTSTLRLFLLLITTDAPLRPKHFAMANPTP